MMQKKSTPSTQTPTVYTDATLRINGQTISGEDYTIHLANVSHVKIGPIAKSSLSMEPFTLLLFLVAISFAIGGVFFIFLGAVGLCVVAYLIIHAIMQPKNYGITFEMNSGKTYAFASKDKAFLQTLLTKVNEIMNDPVNNRQAYCVRFDSSSINAEPTPTRANHSASPSPRP